MKEGGGPVRSDGLGALIDARIREIVREELALARGEGILFRTSGPLPPRVSRKRFNAICRSGIVVDARRDGRDWVVAASAWFAARCARPTTAERTDPANDAAPTLDVDKIIEAEGYRLTRAAK